MESWGGGEAAGWKELSLSKNLWLVALGSQEKGKQGPPPPRNLGPESSVGRLRQQLGTRFRGCMGEQRLEFGRQEELGERTRVEVTASR